MGTKSQNEHNCAELAQNYCKLAHNQAELAQNYRKLAHN